MASNGHTFDACRPALLQNSGLTAACQADTLARPPVGCCSDLSMVHALYCEEGVGLICRIDAYRPKGRWFESRSSRHVGTLGKFFTRSYLWRFGVKLRNSIRAVSGAPLSSGGLEEAL